MGPLLSFSGSARGPLLGQRRLMPGGSASVRGGGEGTDPFLVPRSVLGKQTIGLAATILNRKEELIWDDKQNS
jgi:hypothetical protein